MDPERLLSFAYGGVFIVSTFLFFAIGRATIRELHRPPLTKNPTFVIGASLVVQCIALMLIGYARVDDHLTGFVISGRWPLMLSYAMLLLVTAKIGFHWAATIGKRSWQWWLAVFFVVAWGFYCFML